MLNNCPGKDRLRGAPALKEILCPKCKREIELFSNDSQIVCNCGTIVYNDAVKCLEGDVDEGNT